MFLACFHYKNLLFKISSISGLGVGNEFIFSVFFFALSLNDYDEFEILEISSCTFVKHVTSLRMSQFENFNW